MAAPYIMPDGPGGRPYRLSERDASKPGKGKGSGARGKEEAWSALQAAQAGAGASPDDLSELRAIARAGWRRRNRWLNDKALRDGHAAKFGHMTAEDMQNQFNPPPFGGPERPSVFSKLAGPEHAAAMAAWARVSRPARAALKKASPHAVMQLEHEVTALLEGGDDCAELLVDVPDGFGRLLVHGLCEFHGLLSATRNVGGRTLVAVYFRRGPAKQEQQQQPEQQQGQQQQQQPEHQQGDRAAPAQHEITCADVLLALREAAPLGGFGAHDLGRFVRSMHVGSDAMSEDYVVV